MTNFGKPQGEFTSDPLFRFNDRGWQEVFRSFDERAEGIAERTGKDPAAVYDTLFAGRIVIDHEAYAVSLSGSEVTALYARPVPADDPIVAEEVMPRIRILGSY